MTRFEQRLEQARRHLAAADPVMARLVESVGTCGLRLDRAGTPYSALVEAILYQQLNGKAAATIHERLRTLVGRRHPRPGDLAAADDEQLRGAGLSRQKIGYLRDLTQRVQGGLVLTGLGRLGDEAVVQRLTQIKGVGRWTVEMLLIFRFGRLDVLPLDDYGVRRGAQRAYRLRALPEPGRLKRLGERWRPYRSVAASYLWRAAETTAPLAG